MGHERVGDEARQVGIPAEEVRDGEPETGLQVCSQRKENALAPLKKIRRCSMQKGQEGEILQRCTLRVQACPWRQMEWRGEAKSRE